MIPSYMIAERDEISHKIAELRIYLQQKEVVEYKNYIDNGGNARTARDKVIGELKLDSEDWLEKEVELEEIKKTHATMSFCLETLQKMISTVSAGFLSLDQYQEVVEDYKQFFKE